MEKPAGRVVPSPKVAAGQAELLMAMAGMVDRAKCSDMCFLTRPDAVLVFASKAMLMACLPVFQALLASGFCDAQCTHTTTDHHAKCSSSLLLSKASGTWHKVKVPDIKPHMLHHLLHWCYTNQLHLNLTLVCHRKNSHAVDSPFYQQALI
jgi:hypothetical protein